MKQTATAEDYAAAFEKERQNAYPLIDAFEQRMGYAIDRAKLEEAARVLACPVKKNPPNWMHGRVLYAATCRYLANVASEVSILEIGSAKGFGALCLQWALDNMGVRGRVTSVDVIDPEAMLPDKENNRRNTVAELSGPIALRDILVPWPESQVIRFLQSTGIDWLRTHHERLHVVFVDGKHTADVVRQEAQLIAAKQEPGDLCIFDDVQLTEIRAVVRSFGHSYTLEYLDILPTPDRPDEKRGYAVGVRK